jgi:hypothetical protein
MNVSLTVDPADALHGELARDSIYPGYVQGWAVIKGPPHHREFAGIYAGREDAEAAAAQAGAGFEARWGSYSPEDQDYITGDTYNAN